MAPKKQKRNTTLLAGVLISLVLHPLLFVLYEAARPPVIPRLTVEMQGDGRGLVTASDDSVFCGGKCSAEIEEGKLVTLSANPVRGSTFEGWKNGCSSDVSALFAWGRDAVVRGDARGDSVPSDLLDRLVELSQENTGGINDSSLNPLDCEVFLDGSVTVTAQFGKEPDEVEVALIDSEAVKNIKPPQDPKIDIPVAPEVVLPEEAEPEIEPVPEEPPPEQVAIEKPKPKPEPLNLKSVEVPDGNEVDEAPSDAAFLSDKNRDVAEQTRADETNLEEQSSGEMVASTESDVTSEDVGGEEEIVADIEESEATSIEEEPPSSEAGESDRAIGSKVGEEGDRGTGVDAEAGKLAMRGIDGRGAPGDFEVANNGKPGTGKKGAPGLYNALNLEDYERIVGKESADKEAALAKRRLSQKKGRWERKLGAIKSSLENFTPEVREGNQTALKTRAAPFAVYIARMHRRIHELWGFGFIPDLDAKPATYALNDWKLETKIEIVINPDGTIDKTTIVRPSTELTFDVAALDVVHTAGPFEATPLEIRSPDGKVYMHWNFHRDWRQCGTFGAHPFILDKAPKQRDRGINTDVASLEETLRNRKMGGGGTASNDLATKKAMGNLPAPDDPEVAFASNQWLAGFAQGDIKKLTDVSKLPFRSGGQLVASTKVELESLYKNLIAESKERRPQNSKIVSASGYRKLFGSLPKGSLSDATELYFVIQFEKQILTLVLKQNGRKKYKVIALHR